MYMTAYNTSPTTSWLEQYFSKVKPCLMNSVAYAIATKLILTSPYAWVSGESRISLVHEAVIQNLAFTMCATVGVCDRAKDSGVTHELRAYLRRRQLRRT